MASRQQRATEATATCAPVDSPGPALALAAQNKRKEKARIAARARRSQEASIIMDMANELHITQEKIRGLDKATIVKLAIDYIKAFEILCRFRTICAATSSQTISSSSSGNIQNSQDNSSDSEHAIINITGNIKIESKHHDIDCRPAAATLPPPLSNRVALFERDTNAVDEDQQRQQQQQADYGLTTNINSTARITTTTTTTATRSAAAAAAAAEAAITQAMPTNPPIPKFNTSSIFAHKTDDVDSHFLVIKEQNGRPAFVLKPDTEIMDEDDLTHLAPQAGDCVSLEVEPLDEIELDSSLFKICGCRY